MKRLVAVGEARVFKQGRAQRYWAPIGGGRPDLGVPNPVSCVARHIDRPAAEALGQGLARKKVLGLVGDEEELDSVEPLHRLAYRLDFEEEVPRGLIAKVFGSGTDERVGSVYLHAHNLGVLYYSHERGIWFDDLPKERASDVRDFDGVTELEPRRPGDLAFEDSDWTGRAKEDAVRASFQKRFSARCGAITPIFVPLWVLLLRGEGGTKRRVTVDGLVGRPVRWLPP